MPRIRHGCAISLEQITVDRAEMDSAVDGSQISEGASASDPRVAHAYFPPFDYLFSKLQDNPKNLLPESDGVVEDLKNLGKAMVDPGPNPASGQGIPDSNIPSAYTYFGQFVDHDITSEAVSNTLASITDPGLKPIPLQEIKKRIVNSRTPNLDLDSVYGNGSVRDGNWMLVGRVSYSRNGRPNGKGDYNDLPRAPRSTDPTRDREARIGDGRNDENLIISQLHVAFLHAHNALVNRGLKFDEARKQIRRHYQWIVLNDFLKRVADPDIVEATAKGNTFFKPPKNGFFMPLEFSVGAFRFGHSMVRAGYNDYNELNLNAGLAMLFTFTRFGGEIGFAPAQDSDTLPENWIIQWEHFVDIGQELNFARPIDTTLVEPLFQIPRQVGMPFPDEARLAVRNLLRGYLLRLPTGQAVAKAMGFTPLNEDQIGSVADRAGQLEALKTKSNFISNTPLWYYILAEAAFVGKGHLGPVGSTLVAEVLIEVLRRSDDSILPDVSAPPGEPFVPTLGATPGEFDLSDLLRLAGVLR